MGTRCDRMYWGSEDPSLAQRSPARQCDAHYSMEMGLDRARWLGGGAYMKVSCHIIHRVEIAYLSWLYCTMLSFRCFWDHGWILMLLHVNGVDAIPQNA